MKTRLEKCAYILCLALIPLQFFYVPSLTMMLLPFIFAKSHSAVAATITHGASEDSNKRDRTGAKL